MCRAIALRFNSLDKLEGCPHENLNRYEDLDISNFVCNSIGSFLSNFKQNFDVFRHFEKSVFICKIDPLLTFLSKICKLRLKAILFEN